MSISPPSPRAIKPDPETMEEQDDLLLSYLNADCLSNDATQWPTLSDDHPSPSFSTSSTDSPSNEATADMLPLHSPQAMVCDGDYTQWLAAAGFPAPFPPELFVNFPLCQEPFAPPTFLEPSSFPQPMHASDSSDSEHPKKKRGRKRRDSQPRQGPTPAAIAPAHPKPLATLLPATAARSPCSAAGHATTTTTTNQPMLAPMGTPLIKTEAPPSPQQFSMPPSIQSGVNMTADPRLSQDLTPVKMENTFSPEESQKAAMLAKRQERLIKNRAAALLSRKRKREHLNALEEQKGALVTENDQLKSRVSALEAQVNALEQENRDLRRRLGDRSDNSLHIMPKATGGVVFMIILFSFALFSMPTRTGHRLTVGGPSKELAILGSPSGPDMSYYCERQDNCKDNLEQSLLDSTPSSDASIGASPAVPSTDLVLIDPVRPHALQSWIKAKLQNAAAASVESDEQGLVRWSSPVPSTPALSAATATEANDDAADDQLKRPQIYLYSPEFSQVAPAFNDSTIKATVADESPLLSLISPFESPIADCSESGQQYLQIDVQVLGSRVVDGQLLPLEQCSFASSLLHNLKGNLLGDIVTKTQETEAMPEPTLLSRRLSKDARRRLEGKERAKKISRVIV